MILTDEATRAKHLASGIWGTATLDAVFRKNANARPDRLAIADAPDHAAWTSGAPQRLSYGEADRMVSRIARLFSHLGLAPDQIVATMLPNSAMTVLIHLAAWRAGLIVAPLPLTWRRRSIKPALEAIGAQAIVTLDMLEGEDVGTQMRDVAADLFAIRHVLGIGDRLAEGVIGIEPAVAAFAAAEPAPEIDRKENAADHVATVTFAGTADGRIVPVPRSHNQWVAAGLMPLLEARMEQGSTILSPFMPTGLAGFAGALLPWLLSGGTLHLHHFRSLDGFAAHCRTAVPDHVLCPAALSGHAALALERCGSAATLVPVWPGTHAARAPLPIGERDVVDLTVLDELAVIARTRDEAELPKPLPLGAVGAPSGADRTLVLVELATRKLEGEDGDAPREVLQVRGPMAPAAGVMRSFEFVPTSAGGWLETSILAAVGQGLPRTAVPNARAGRLIMVGGLPVGVTELDNAYADHDAVRGSALFVARQDLVPKLGLAVVPEHAAPFAMDDARRHAEAAGLAGHARPETVTRAASLPRKRSGALDEDALHPTLRTG